MLFLSIMLMDGQFDPVFGFCTPILEVCSLGNITISNYGLTPTSVSLSTEEAQKALLLFTSGRAMSEASSESRRREQHCPVIEPFS